MKLWLARHAQPLVKAGICYGRRDVPDDPSATTQCAKALAALLPANTCVVSSPLQRCEHLAQLIQALRPDLIYTIDPRLQEMDFGLWEGQPWQAIAQTELEAWTSDFANYAVGHNGEAVSRFMKRVAAAFDELQKQGNTLWITHAGVIRAVELIARGRRQIERADQWPLDAPNYGQWRTLALPIGQPHSR